MSHRSGRHFLQIPGPTNVPDRVLRAIDQPTIDHRGPDFQQLVQRLQPKLRQVFRTEQPVVVYPSSGTGAWEAALVNTLSPGDKVLMFETGHFATLWEQLTHKLGLETELVPGDWRHGVDPEAVEARLREDVGQTIKALCVVHNETSTGVTSRIGAIREAIDRAGHPCLFLVDTISGLGAADYRHDDWGVDVTVCGSQKGLMLPPGLGFNAVSRKALEAAERAQMPRSYWDWGPILQANEGGLFSYTPATNLLYGLDAALDLLLEAGLDDVVARHERHAAATRAAVAAWGLDVQAADPAEYSPALTAVRLPEGHDADRLRQLILERFDMSLGGGLAQLKGRVFRIGHLGDFNDLMLSGTLAGVEMGLALAGVPHRRGGVQAAFDVLTGQGAQPGAVRAAG